MRLLVECATQLIGDAAIRPCREAEATGARRLVERRNGEARVLRWDRGFPSRRAICEVGKRAGQVLGRLSKPFVTLADGSDLTDRSQDHEPQRGARMLVRVIRSTVTDPRLPGAGEEVSRLVTTWRCAPTSAGTRNG